MHATPKITARERFERAGASTWLVVGALLLVAANMRWGVGVLAWVAPVPWLRYLRITSGIRSRALFGAAMVVAWTLATLKIVTAPLPIGFALLGVGFGMVQTAGYLVADAVRRRTGEALGIAAVPAALVVIEWLQHRVTDLSSWAAAGYTQVDDLPLLQLASVTGIAGVSFLVYLTAAALESVLSTNAPSAKRALAVTAALVALAHGAGAWRLASARHGDATLAAIDTDATFGPQHTPTDAERERTLARLFADTHTAAHAGAQLAVWTEAAALVMPDEEPAFVQRLRRAALQDRIHIVAAYIVLQSRDPLRFENKYRWVRPDGAIDHSYWKHHPVPGEPAVVGTGPLPTVETAFGRAGGALCYDYDYPALAAEHGRNGVDLVALPSSDWRGIDPLHTRMAALRAIEQGVSIVRSTRFGLSAGIDPWGRMVAQRSSFASKDRVLTVELPRRGVSTFYRRHGDLLVYASALYLLALLAVAGLRFTRALPSSLGPARASPSPAAAGPDRRAAAR